jgi:DNA-binding transcriptional regulator/RsmH inhibitor MraZ
MDERPAMPQMPWGTARKLSFAEARQEQRDEAARMSIPERLALMTELNRRAFVIAREEVRDPNAAYFVRRPQLRQR